MAITADTIVAPAPGVETRRYLKGMVIDPGISLNEVASFIFSQFDGERSLKQVAEAVTREYRISLDDCLPDVIGTASELVEFNVVRIVSP